MIREMLNVMAPMRDGVNLACNVYRPDDEKPYPAILLRTPYIKERIGREDLYANYREMALSGYNMIFQDVRGAGASEGVLDTLGAAEYDDGYDTIEWIAAQPWCDGNVGMQGLSYFGFTQMAAAESNPPHLKAICPFQNSAVHPFSVTKAMTFGNYHLYWIYERVLENLTSWFPDEAEREKVAKQIKHYQENWQEEMFKLPLYDTPAARIEGIPHLNAYLELLDGMEAYEHFMRRTRRPARIEDIKVPMFLLSGWFDGARDGTVDNWNLANAGSLQAHEKKLMLGPWQHGGKLTSKIENRDFGGDDTLGVAEVRELVKRWFDYWLKNEDNGIADEPPVRYFTLGDQIWNDSGEWPPKNTEQTLFYMHGGADKNSGMLNCSAPGDETPQVFVYDPENPLPSDICDDAGRRVFASPVSQQERGDVLVYTSSALEQDMEVTGLVTCRLFASTTAQDTDFFCRLCDLDEDGYAFPLVSGIVRGKFRNGTTPELLEPGKAYSFAVELGNISCVIKKGHRVRLDISSSCYPLHNRNLNTADRIGHGAYSVKATQSIYHDSAHPSCLVLPVMHRS